MSSLAAMATNLVQYTAVLFFQLIKKCFKTSLQENLIKHSGQCKYRHYIAYTQYFRSVLDL